MLNVEQIVSLTNQFQLQGNAAGIAAGLVAANASSPCTTDQLSALLLSEGKSNAQVVAQLAAQQNLVAGAFTGAVPGSPFPGNS